MPPVCFFVQAPADDMVSSLISVFEGFQSLQLRSRSAITTHEHITLEDVLDRMNLFWRCAGPTSSHVCQAHFASVPLGNAGYIPGRNGYGIVVQLRTRPPPNLLLVPQDGLNLLQLNVHRGLAANDFQSRESKPVDWPHSVISEHDSQRIQSGQTFHVRAIEPAQ